MITARNESAPVAGYLEVDSRVTSPLPSLRPLSAPGDQLFTVQCLIRNLSWHVGPRYVGKINALRARFQVKGSISRSPSATGLSLSS